MKEKEIQLERIIDFKTSDSKHNIEISYLGEGPYAVCESAKCNNLACWESKVSQDYLFNVVFRHCPLHSHGTKEWNELFNMHFQSDVNQKYLNLMKPFAVDDCRITIEKISNPYQFHCDEETCLENGILKTEIQLHNKPFLCFHYCPKHTHGLTEWGTVINNSLTNFREELGRQLDKVAKNDK